MKFLQLIVKNITRKKTRMLLTFGSFTVALFLFGLLFTLNDAFDFGLELAGVDRLLVRSKTSYFMTIPYSYKEKIRKVPGVKALYACCWFDGVYQNERNRFPQWSI